LVLEVQGVPLALTFQECRRALGFLSFPQAPGHLDLLGLLYDQGSLPIMNGEMRTDVVGQ